MNESKKHRIIVYDELKLGHSCKLTAEHITDREPDVALEFVCYSSDQWHRDAQTRLNITPHMAVDIVNFLSNHFNLER
jgi:hypothetical protein